ncbi:MAG TPA: RNA polymerase sigma factor [Vicinamibacterales bacterium]|jgi:RNA polymerase sigma-70 factor (ECF subfamily)
MSSNLGSSAASAAEFERLMRQHNQRLFRVARSILRDDADAEDALQDAYVQAYRKLGDFRGDAELSTWLTRIVINQALMRVRSRSRDRNVISFSQADAASPEIDVPDVQTESPSDAALRGEVRKVLEQRIDELPENFRTVFVMREVEEMTARETAAALGIPEATVRTRLFRARALLREALDRDVDSARGNVFGFDGTRCDRIVAAVLARL